MARSQVLYKAANGAGFSDNKAQVYGTFLEREVGLGREAVTPYEIVDASRPVGSPTHDAFEWDDSVAAEEFRADQARHLVNHLVVVEQTPGGPVEARAFHSVVRRRDDEPPVRGYIAQRVVWRDSQLSDQVHRAAVRTIESWIARWGWDDDAWNEADLLWRAHQAARRRASEDAA